MVDLSFASRLRVADTPAHRRISSVLFYNPHSIPWDRVVSLSATRLTALRWFHHFLQPFPWIAFLEYSFNEYLLHPSESHVLS